MGTEAFAKGRRLDRVRSELKHADSKATTVTEVAKKYAFWHPGQFASDYQKQFNEMPTHTLALIGSRFSQRSIGSANVVCVQFERTDIKEGLIKPALIEGEPSL